MAILLKEPPFSKAIIVGALQPLVFQGCSWAFAGDPEEPEVPKPIALHVNGQVQHEL